MNNDNNNQGHGGGGQEDAPKLSLRDRLKAGLDKAAAADAPKQQVTVDQVVNSGQINADLARNMTDAAAADRAAADKK